VRVLAALGGNALARRGEPLDLEVQRGNAARAAASLAPLARAHELLVTHGNGPQVGLLALQSEAAAGSRTPLDVLGAESEGMIGYLLEQELRNALRDWPVVTVLTQVQVDAADSAFERPTKPIGPVYDRAEAEKLAADRGWRVARDGAHWRRVVPSPEPRRVLEARTLLLLVRSGAVVVCAGGGGIPVVRGEDGRLHGVEAVIDKDASSALLAQQLGVDFLLLLTDVDAVYRGFGTPAASPIREAAAQELARERFDAGSMGPKVRAACRFAAATGRPAAIGALEQAAAILAGESGTRIRAAPAERR
jgi:carbamate kinase